MSTWPSELVRIFFCWIDTGFMPFRIGRNLDFLFTFTLLLLFSPAADNVRLVEQSLQRAESGNAVQKKESRRHSFVAPLIGQGPLHLKNATKMSDIPGPEPTQNAVRDVVRKKNSVTAEKAKIRPAKSMGSLPLGKTIDVSRRQKTGNSTKHIKRQRMRDEKQSIASTGLDKGGRNETSGSKSSKAGKLKASKKRTKADSSKKLRPQTESGKVRIPNKHGENSSAPTDQRKKRRATADERKSAINHPAKKRATDIQPSSKRRKVSSPTSTSFSEKASKSPQSTHTAEKSAAPQNGTLLLTKLTFDKLQPALHNTTLAALAELGFHYTAPVQQTVIPLLLSHKDVAVEAATGSGKTVAFLVPAYELLLHSQPAPWPPDAVGSIIIAPTRELAAQISAIAAVLSRHTRLPSHLLSGGVANETADLLLLRARGGSVLVATPGRLESSLIHPAPAGAGGGGGNGGGGAAMDVSKVELLVLDEADRLLEMGFEPCLNRILSRIPRQRRTGLFSATMFAGVTDLIRAGMRNPRRVLVASAPAPAAPSGGSSTGAHAAAATAGAPQATPRELTNYVVRTDARRRVGDLLRFLRGAWPCKAMVFFLTCHTVDYLTALLPRLNECGPVRVTGMHGRMVQKKRDRTFAAFSAAAEGVLLCTDVAARGLDIPDVHWIVQFDAPQDPDYFIHRVGRTARMGRPGQSVLMLLPNEGDYLPLLQARGVPLQPLPPAYLPTASVPSDMLSSMRAAVSQDLDLHERGQRAFVSAVRGYREHRCPDVFRLADLDLPALAAGLGLLRLPYMRELVAAGARAVRGLLTMAGFEADPTDPATLRYRDPVREKARTRRLALAAAAAAAEGPSTAGVSGTSDPRARRALAQQRVAEARQASWSRKLRRMERREKRLRRRQRAMMPGTAGKLGRTGGDQGAGGNDADGDMSSGEEEQLRAEAALLRKLRRRRLTPEQYERAAGYSDIDPDGPAQDSPEKAGEGVED